MRIKDHPILGKDTREKTITIKVDGKDYKAIDGEPIAAALIANGIKKFRYTQKKKKPRGLFCAIGRCTDCVMTVNGIPNIRTCVTPAENGMIIETQKGLGEWRR